MNIFKYRKFIFFLFLFACTVLFYIWSRLLWISIGILIISDILSTRKIPFFLSKKLNKKLYSSLKYLGFVILPILIAVFVRTFFFDVYFVPSSSMERTLLPNDYVLVNKFMHGAKIPKYLNDIPVIGSLFERNETGYYNPYRSLKAFKRLSREDIVVFKSTEISSKFLVKRIIGLPGDTLKIKDTNVYINNKKLPEKDTYCYNYVEKTDQIFKVYETLSNGEYNALSYEEKSKLKKVNDSISNSYFIFPYSKQNEWSRDNYGSVVVPKKGESITISSSNYILYKTTIKKHENQNFILKKGESKKYTFKNNYYFMLGDNRHNSIDSRSYGFIPESYIQGKVINKF